MCVHMDANAALSQLSYEPECRLTATNIIIP